MITKRERKVYGWLDRPEITQRQIFKMRRQVRADVLRLVRLNGWRHDILARRRLHPGYIEVPAWVIDALETVLAEGKAGSPSSSTRASSAGND